jgi:ABC-type bacteriocin/lantibiotic exporter with double-glycine peptidase domain
MKIIKLFEQFKITPKVKLDFPELRQIYNYDCGVTAMQQVLIYYGIEKREDELIKLLDTKKTTIIEHGTKLSKMIEVFKYFALDAEIVRNSSIKEVKKLIDDGIPPIILMQAWRDYSVGNLDWEKDYSDGHYVVAIGYNDNCIFFEDPASVTRTYLSFDEFEKRWHDVDDNNKTKNNHVMVVVKGEKKYNSKLIVHMD